MRIKTRYANIKFAYIVLATFVSCRLWSFQGVPDRIFDILEFFVAFTLIIIVIARYHKFAHSHAQFKNNVSLFIWIPIISSLAAALFHNQPLYLSMFILRTNFFWLLYFTLHIFNIPVKNLIRLMVFVGIIWAVLTIVQQFTYPHYLFYNRNGEEEGQDFMRAGVYRFMLDPHFYGLFVVVYFYNRFLIKKNISSLFFVLIGILGFYFFGTRQFAVATFACIIFASITQKGKIVIYSTILIILITSLLVVYRHGLFDEYVDMTKDQLESKDEVRKLAAKFYLFKYWPNWVTTIIGNGKEHNNSIYGKEILTINKNWGYYRCDIGIIGAFNTFGLFYIINILWLNFKGLKKKYYTESNKYLKLLFFNSLILLFISEYYSYSSAIPFFCFVLFLVDKSYEEKQLNTRLQRSKLIRVEAIPE